MLFRREFASGIADGSITLTFRTWRRAHAPSGGQHRVPGVGVIAIESVDTIAVQELTDAEAIRSGFPDRGMLIAELERSTRLAPGQPVYRVAFHIDGAGVIETKFLSDAEISRRLDSLDGRAGAAWTREVLSLIGQNPGVSSAKLAPRLGRERFALKTDVRKLKRLGLTESLQVGYRLTDIGRRLAGIE